MNILSLPSELFEEIISFSISGIHVKAIVSGLCNYMLVGKSFYRLLYSSRYLIKPTKDYFTLTKPTSMYMSLSWRTYICRFFPKLNFYEGDKLMYQEEIFNGFEHTKNWFAIYASCQIILLYKTVDNVQLITHECTFGSFQMTETKIGLLFSRLGVHYKIINSKLIGFSKNPGVVVYDGFFYNDEVRDFDEVLLYELDATRVICYGKYLITNTDTGHDIYSNGKRLWSCTISEARPFNSLLITGNEIFDIKTGDRLLSIKNDITLVCMKEMGYIIY